jgi:hypothetical protein
VTFGPVIRGCAFPGIALGVVFILVLMLSGAALFKIFGMSGAPLAAPAGQGLNAGNGAANGNGAGQPAPTIPPISDRLFTGGSSQATVTGDVSMSVNQSTDKVRSYVKDGLSWIGFGTEGANDGTAEILVTFGEGDPGNTVNVTSGDRVAIGKDDQCQFSVHVTDTLVSGHVSCPNADVFNGTEVVGKVSIELDFSASS